MSVKIVAMHSLKLPHPDPSIEFGSIGASVSIEGTPPESMSREQLADYTRALLEEARVRTEEHLAKHGGQSAPPPTSSAPATPHRPMRGPNGRTNGNGSYASAKQLSYLRALAKEQQLGYAGLQELAQREFGTADVLHLSRRQASSLIDRLRGDGQG